MLEPAYQVDVVVVGAGIAGLAAARRLASAGVSTAVLEADACVGGRMATEKVDGFRLDRLGQPLFTSWSELRTTPGLDALPLRRFAPGVLLHRDGHRHRAGAPAVAGGARGALHMARALASAPRGPGSARESRTGGAAGGAMDRARLGSALNRLAATPVERLLSRPELPAAQALQARGLPPRTVEGFLRPLLAALLCDPELTTSSRAADLALHAFAGGRLCVPEGGAQALPDQLTRSLPPGTVRTGVRVTSVSTTSVTTAEHGVIRCRAVLLATGARAAAELLPGLRVPDFHPVTVVHHTTDDPAPALATGSALLLDADRGGPVAHTAVLSTVDPGRAPAGRVLISSTVLGTPPGAPGELDSAVRIQLARLYGTSTHRWETLAVHHIPEAVPALRPPYDARRPVRLMAGLYVCGDHRDSGTVQGALHSAHRAAAALLSDLGAAGSMHRADPAATVPRAA
ncbi:NAD(P)/FAD-dependent oxidoreductase [Streptomyces sp. NPDC004549]|uniref:NAD(P)/FAD-dependent oxidoreductase n=1 Tax=Streptomyces sp. NPDC004549 TaxID=3154283 RepID=UPI0033BD46BB